MALNPYSQHWRWDVAQMLGAYVSDTPPANPNGNQLWFNSTTGGLYVWYVDPDSAQWVQVSQPGNMDFVKRAGDTMNGLLTLSGVPTAALHAATKGYVDGRSVTLPPVDNGEYAMVNGGWRLRQQTFDMAGKVSQNIAVPAWGPTQARLAGFVYSASAGGQTRLRVSGDGTFFDDTNIYTGAGFYHISATNAFNNYGNVTSTFFVLGDTTDNIEIAQHFDAVIDLQRSRGATGYVNYRVKSGAYYSANQMVQYNFDGWVQPSTGSGLLKAFQISSVNAASAGKIVVEWLA
jgi:hypothetical protein